MKRYTDVSTSETPTHAFVEAFDGEWVKFDDLVQSFRDPAREIVVLESETPSRRDLFAMAAMQAIRGLGLADEDWVARESVKQADALVKALAS